MIADLSGLATGRRCAFIGRMRSLFFEGLSAAAVALASPVLASPVHLWDTDLVVPTYLAAPPSTVPRFYDGRTYQGAKATFYPYPVQDVLTDVKSNVTYKALFLENDYVQICVLPELGGRIFSAVDKGNGYDFFYRQHVIKPALIGMLGAWISGGVEWNVPHHHRASSFSPVDYTTQTNADGSATIWVGEIELRHRMKWLVGMTLYPDRSYLELTCRMFNRTPFAHPMLFWINPAVHANENYQVIFPPGTEWVTQHGKPEFASWPVARQHYGGTDYTRGVDISWWKNHDTPKSFFAWNYEDDWFGGYDHGKQAGVLHVADHHVVPGKKFFEWGNGPEGEMWTKILTDEDGPYLELMAGAWSDNQPDYSWIQPGETREWQHWWYPVRNLGGVKAATRDAAVNLEVTNRMAKIAVNVTREVKGAKVQLVLVQPTRSTVSSHPSTRLQGGADTGANRENRMNGLSSGQQTAEAVEGGSPAQGTPLKRGANGSASSAPATLFSQTVDLSPARPFSATTMIELDVPAERVGLSVTDADGKELVVFQPAPPKNSPMPKPVEKPKSPKDYTSADELYFTGQRVEQLYSPSFEAAPYYEEMLRRDPGDYRANTAMGILLCKQWRWDEAAAHLSNAVARATANYIRPKDGEAFYYLGVALRGQATTSSRYLMRRGEEWYAKFSEAGEAFLRASWNTGWQSPSFFQLAEIRCNQERFPEALQAIDQCLATNHRSTKAMNLRAAILRRLGRFDEAARSAARAAAIDPLDTWAPLERFLAETSRNSDLNPRSRSTGPSVRVPAELLAKAVSEVLELITDYANAGLEREAADVAWCTTTRPDEPQGTTLVLADPLLHYYAGYFGPGFELTGLDLQYARAGWKVGGGCFPFQYEAIEVLRADVSASRNTMSSFLLGNLLYDNQPDQAIVAWEAARGGPAERRYRKETTDLDALVHRNLGFAYAQHEKNLPKAIASYEKASELDPTEPRFFYELDVQYEANGTAVAKRLEILTKHHDVVAKRDDALTREIALLTVAGQADRAVGLLRGRHFRNWEGSGQIHNVYVDACLTYGQRLLGEKKSREALRSFEAALEYPENLEVGRARRSPRTAQIQHHIGTAHEALGDAAKAKTAFEQAAAGRGGGSSEGDYFRALALQKIGRADDAKPVFEGLIKAGGEQLTKDEAADYFAKFGERQSQRVREANAHYLIGLGQQGLGDKAKAETEFKKALELHPGHLGVVTQLSGK
jgi:tetratricopeptide (TPR) repeat protein